MNLVWCMIALILTGTDDPTPTQTPHLSSPPAADSEKEVWPLRLDDAIRIGLDNSECVRVLSFGAQGIPVGNCFGSPGERHPSPATMVVDLANGYRPENSSIVISPIKSDVSICRLRSEMMAHVRSVEQQYWNLAQAHAALCWAEQAVRMAQEVVKKEQDELVFCRAGCADLAEAAQRLEQFKQELVKRNADVLDNERRLRNILGLPPADNRRIIPVTRPIELHVVFDWETCLDEMMHDQPDVTQKQLVDQTTQRVARFYAEVEAGYQQYTKARRMRAAANERLQAQQCYYNEGRITADRYLDAIGQFAALVVAEHQYLVTYNITLAALSESKGTLLAERNIVVAPAVRKTEAKQTAGGAKDDQARPASFVGPTPVADEPAVRNAPLGVENDAEPESQEIWPMTLKEAIAVALDNSEIVRVISLGDRGISIGGCRAFDTGPEPPPRPALPAEVPVGVKNDGQSFVIARLNADAGRFRFKSEVMAHVRSVEQQYWTLAQAHSALWAADKAANLAQDVVETVAAAGLHCCRVDELAGVRERLEQFERGLVDRTADVITAERALRNILGLPESDNRRIIPVTPPDQARLEPDWETCLDEMMQQQPDVIQQKVLTRVAQLQLVIARHPGLPQVNLNTLYQMNALGQTLDTPEEALMSTFLEGLDVMSPKSLKRFKKSLARSNSDALDVLELVARELGEAPQRRLANTRQGLVNTRQAQYALLRSRAFLKQVVHQTTHSLARGFLQVDAGYKSYAMAERLRRAAEQRLETQRVRWEEGRITTDGFLDTVEQYAALVATEHHYLADFNSAIAFLSECKGTLLADHNIMVAEPPRRGNGQQTAERVQDDQARKASFTPATPQLRKPTFLELWQVSTCPWLVPSLMNAPDPTSNETESEPAAPETSAKPG